MPSHPLQFIPPAVRPRVAELAAKIIEQASSFGRDHWGVTPYPNAVRVNVGWTEILTAFPEHLRLIIDGKLVQEAGTIPGVTLNAGEDPRGFYPSIPGSVCAEIPYRLGLTFEHTIDVLSPALIESIRLAARRRAGRGVKAGHNQQAVQALASIVGRPLPTPGYLSIDDEISTNNVGLMEGALHRVVGSQYERNPTARLICIKYYGAVCFVCNFSFESAYGQIGRGFIHVHHLTPISSIGESYQIDPIEDLRPACPNCHAMLHRREPPLTIVELQDLLLRKQTIDNSSRSMQICSGI